MNQRKSGRYERYEFERSPWTQNLKQSDVATLLGFTKTQLEALIRDKETFIRRETKDINGKLRQLAVPIGKLRRCHEVLKYHLNKIRQPDYLFSPRKGRSQRDNAARHVGQNQFLKVDVCKFYPSTSGEHIFRWAYHVAGLRSDVAGLLKHLVAIDDRMPFGSPVSPILISLVHRPMFDQVFAASARCGVLMSLWVDNLVLSGPSVPGALLREIRDIIRGNGFQTHDIRFQEASRPVTITGVPIEDGRVVAPRSVHQRVKDGYVALRAANTDSDRLVATDVLLSNLGTYRYLVGSTTLEGRKTADRMNVLRRRRAQLAPIFITRPSTPLAVTPLMVIERGDTAPF